MADNGGMKLAYLAYEKSKQIKGAEKKSLPGLSQFNDDQIFFLSFAHVSLFINCKTVKFYPASANFDRT